MINTNDIELVKKLILKEQKPIIVKAQNGEFNRNILDYGKFDVLLFPEEGETKNDKLKKFDLGLNHVLANIAKKKNIKFGIDIGEIKRLDRKNKGKNLGRIIEIIDICKKSGVSLICYNYDDERNASAILLSLGASTQQASEAVKSNYSDGS
ncbi:MAG: hypothetical protein Q7S74_03950 [Nanoarchaeota archaeon]|nr:hypothetical protein [Nanoarchaeota archaeon]